MHKVIFEPSSPGIYEYKEKCLNEKCTGNTVWVYTASFLNPNCGDCHKLLTGKQLMLYEINRMNYHLGA